MPSLVLGVAAAHATHSNALVAGVAGLVAGSMSMAAGEYVSVHSQADTEQADLKQECAELKADDKGEHEELAAIGCDLCRTRTRSCDRANVGRATLYAHYRQQRRSVGEWFRGAAGCATGTPT